MMVDVVEAALDVSLNDLGIRHPAPSSILVTFLRQGRSPDIFQGPVAAPSGPEPVGDMPELGLEYRLQKRFDRALNDAIFDRGNAQGSEFPWFASLRNELAPRRARPICATAQFGLERDEEAVLTPVPYASHGHPVDA